MVNIKSAPLAIPFDTPVTGMRTPPPPRLGSPATMKGDNEQMTVVKVGRTKTGNKNNKWSGKRLTTVIKMKEF